jgi:hypothetical protein
MTRDEGPLSIMHRFQTVREGWSRDYRTCFMGNGGETLELLTLTSAISASAHVQTVFDGENTTYQWKARTASSSRGTRWPAWAAATSKSTLLQAQPAHQRRQFVEEGPQTTGLRTLIFSAAAADKGVTFEWDGPDADRPSPDYGSVSRISLVRIWKKDDHGDWKDIIYQSPTRRTSRRT